MEGCMSCMYFYIQNAVRWCCGIQHSFQYANGYIWENWRGILPILPPSLPLKLPSNLHSSHLLFRIVQKPFWFWEEPPSCAIIQYIFHSLSLYKPLQIWWDPLFWSVCLCMLVSCYLYPPFFQSLLPCPEFTCFLFHICNECAHSRAD